MRDLRRFISGLVIVSFSVAALLGIAAILGSGEFSETEGRVILTTVIVGFESVAVLCYLALAGSRFAAVGVVGGAASVVAAALALLMTWTDGNGLDLWRAFGVSVTLAGSLAQASLLLALAGRRQVRALLGATLLAIGVVAALVIVPIVTESQMNDAYWKALGVVAILDVLGTVVVTAMSFYRPAPASYAASSAAPSAAPEAPTRLLTPTVEARVLALAEERGTSPSQVVSDALDVLRTAR